MPNKSKTSAEENNVLPLTPGASDVRQRASRFLSKMTSRDANSRSVETNVVKKQRKSKKRVAGDGPPSSDWPKPIEVSPYSLLDVATVIQLNETIPRAKHLQDETGRQISTLYQRFGNIREWSGDICEWLKKNKLDIIQESDDPEAKVEEIEAKIAYYKNQHACFGRHMGNLRKQLDAMESKMAHFVEHSNHRNQVVKEYLLETLGPDVFSKCFALNEPDFELHNPVDPVFLESCEQDCSDLASRTLGEAALSKYPSRPIHMWHHHVEELENARHLYDRALSRLEAVGNGHPIYHLGIAQDPEAIQGLVIERRKALAAAVEGVRYAGLRCRSSGSLIWKTEDSDTASASMNEDVAKLDADLDQLNL